MRLHVTIDSLFVLAPQSWTIVGMYATVMTTWSARFETTC